MTPTLLGRIETRIVLLALVGVPLTLIVAGLLDEVSLGPSLLMLVVMAVLGLGWELAYHALQQLRWDKDWPSILALVTVVPEAALAWPVLGALGLQPSSVAAYVVHFGVVWMAIWLVMQGPLRVLAPQWRFQGMRFNLRPTPTPTRAPALVLVPAPAPTPVPVPVLGPARVAPLPVQLPARHHAARTATRPERSLSVSLSSLSWPQWPGVASRLGAVVRRTVAQRAVLMSAVALGVVVIGIWLLTQTFNAETPATLAAPDRSTSTQAVTQPDQETKETAAGHEARRVWDTTRRVDPTSLALPQLGLYTALARVDLNPSGTLQTPADATQAGWYQRGVAPGEKGPAVIIGQTSGPRAVFADLEGLSRGEGIVIARKDGTRVLFHVVRVQRVGFADFPTQAVYGPTARPTLRLVGFQPATASHGGENVIVYATAHSLIPKQPAG